MENENAEITQAETPPPKERTKLEQFEERLRQYPTRDEAKTHILEISRDLGCVKSMGYKALKKIEFRGETHPLETSEPSVKIKPPPEGEAFKPDETEGETEISEEIPPSQGTQPPTGKETPSPIPVTAEQLSWTLKIAFQKLADLTKYPDFALKSDEADQLGKVWFPVMQMYMPTMLDNPLVWAGITTTVVFAPRLIGYWQHRQKTKKDKPVEPPPQKPPEEKQPEKPPEQPHEPTLEEIEKNKHNQKPPFLHKLN